jgi:hypothetical protein
VCAVPSTVKVNTPLSSFSWSNVTAAIEPERNHAAAASRG